MTPFEGIGRGDVHVSPYQMPTCLFATIPNHLTCDHGSGLSQDQEGAMPEEKTRTCSTRNALEDMLETASRQLSKTLRSAGEGRAITGQEAVERARAAVASLTTRLAAHRDIHHC
jgi:hypothetical protein